MSYSSAIVGFFDARVAGLEPETSELASKLVTIVGERLERPVEGMIWARHALAAARRIGDPLEEAYVLRTRAAVRMHQSDRPGAAADLQRALELDGQDATPDPLRLASAARAMGTLRRFEGKHAEAEALMREAIELRAGVLGAQHLSTPEAREMLIRATHGIPRLISHILRVSLILADERGQSSIDPAIVHTATLLLHLEAAKPIVMPPPRPRSDRDPRSRG